MEDRSKAPRPENGGGRVRIDARVPADILTRIDEAARRLGLTRSGFLISSAVEKVERLKKKAAR